MFATHRRASYETEKQKPQAGEPTFMPTIGSKEML